MRKSAVLCDSVLFLMTVNKVRAAPENWASNMDTTNSHGRPPNPFLSPQHLWGTVTL